MFLRTPYAICALSDGEEEVFASLLVYKCLEIYRPRDAAGGGGVRDDSLTYMAGISFGRLRTHMDRCPSLGYIIGSRLVAARKVREEIKSPSPDVG